MGFKFVAPKLTGFGTGNINQSQGKLKNVEYDGYAVTTSDSTDLPNGPTDAIYATVSGNIAVQLVRTDNSGNVTVLATTTLLTVAAGEILPIAVSRILATNTTATGIFALYRNS